MYAFRILLNTTYIIVWYMYYVCMICGCIFPPFSILQLFLKSGYSVVLFDTQTSQLQQAQGYISSELEAMQVEGGPLVSDVMKKLKLTENLKEAMDGVFYVQVNYCVYGYTHAHTHTRVRIHTHTHTHTRTHTFIHTYAYPVCEVVAH